MAMTRAERQALTREKLIDAAGELFVERGLQGTSVEAIAERAGFTRGAFYSNFSTKEEVFAELLQTRLYAAYRRMTESRLAMEDPLPTARETAETLAAIQAHPDGRWMFRLWMELVSHAGRDDKTRGHAREFWRTNRELIAQVSERAIDRKGLSPHAAATALIAMDIGLSIQHHVDPDAVPLDLYPEIFGALFDP